MKSRLILALSLIGLTACSPAPTAVETPPPAPPETVEPPSPPRARSTGLLDWNFYRPWTQETPTLIVVSSLDQPTRVLLGEQSNLLHAVLELPSAAPTGGNDSNYFQNELERIKGRFPPRNSTSFERRHEVRLAGGGIRVEYRTVTITLEEGFWNSYRSMFGQLSVGNIDSVLTNVERRIARDMEQARSGLTGSDGLRHQSSLTLSWLGQLSSLVAEGRRVQLDMSRASDQRPPARPDPRIQWASWEAQNLPILQKVISQNTLGQFPLAEDSTYLLEANGEILIHFKIAGRDIYLHEHTPGHRLRFYNKRILPP